MGSLVPDAIVKEADRVAKESLAGHGVCGRRRGGYGHRSRYICNESVDQLARNFRQPGRVLE